MRPFGVSLILLTAFLGVPAPASAETGTTTRVSVAGDGTQANLVSRWPAISGDGRYVAFESAAPNLVPGDTNNRLDVFVHDLDTGGIERVSVAGDGAQATSNSFQPTISADGRYVAFYSDAGNLVPGDTNGTQDVFVRDRVAGSTERVSVAGDGSQANSSSFEPAISADGRYVAFESNAGNLVPGDTNFMTDVFVRDRATGSTERVSVASEGSQATGQSFGDPAISSDGRYVAFNSLANNLVPGDTNGTKDVFVRDRVAGSTERVSVAGDGTEANGESHEPAISSDGRHVAFRSVGTNLAPGDTNGTDDMFVRDRVTGSTERVSVASDGTQANSQSYLEPEISADGRYVTFQSVASNLVAADTNGTDDVFVRDRVAGSTERVSLASDGTQANGQSVLPAISGDGRYVVFQSVASNLVPGDTNGAPDVFVRDRQGIGPSDTTPPTLTLPDPISTDATGPAGATVTYTATATDTADPNPTVSCEPASGATFPIRATTVSCTATDAAGNQATGSFTITVIGAAGQLEDLKALIIAYPLKATVEASLLSKITGTQDAVAAGKTGSACSKLADFLGQVADFQAARRVTAAQATELTADGTRIRAVLGC
ncbi:HYR domain-containing protein [Arthrobacter sp. 754]|uniref:HYR domain-containing protein n=1 Tax=Arthrobacter sp. 754 TaxID=3156315 RepID=UPI00339A0D78